MMRLQSGSMRRLLETAGKPIEIELTDLRGRGAAFRMYVL